MPLFHDYKLYFVHIPKTGGTTIDTMFLSNDIMKLIYSHEYNDKYLVGRCKYNNNFLLQHCPLEYIIKNNYLNNITKSYYRFAIVRNPYDRLISSWAYYNKVFSITLNDFINKITNCSDKKSSFYIFTLPQHKYIYDSKLNLLVDKIIYFERYNEELSNFLNNRKINIKIFHENKTEHKKYNEYLTRDMYNKINDYYDLDFKLFGYKKE